MSHSRVEHPRLIEIDEAGSLEFRVEEVQL